MRRDPSDAERRPPPGEVTDLLTRWHRGDRAALEELMPIVYSELRRLAQSQMASERQDHTLQATALVNEAYLCLFKNERPNVTTRAHFFSVAALVMRRLLVDHARFRSRGSRWGTSVRVELDEDLATVQPSEDLVALDEALTALAATDARAAKIVELRYFGGMTVEEVAALLGIGPATVARDWRHARAWLLDRLGSGEGS